MKVTIKSIVAGGCSCNSCAHNHTGICSITDESHMKETLAIMVQYIGKKTSDLDLKWDCKRYERG